MIRLTTEATRLGCEVETARKEAAQARAERDEAKGRMVSLHAELEDLRSEMAISRQKVAAAMEGMHPYLPHIPPPPPRWLPRWRACRRRRGEAPGLGRGAQGAPRQARRHQRGWRWRQWRGAVRDVRCPRGLQRRGEPSVLRGFFSSKSDAPHSQPSAASNVYIGSASNWPL